MDIPIVINEGSKVNGVFALTNTARIEGQVFGKIESSRDIIIGKTGYMKGVLYATDLVVCGRLEGTAVVMGTTRLFPGSSISGNLYTGVINVEEGAVVQANIIVRDELEANDRALIHQAEENIRLLEESWIDNTFSLAQTTFENIFKMLDRKQKHFIFLQTENEIKFNFDKIPLSESSAVDTNSLPNIPFELTENRETPPENESDPGEAAPENGGSGDSQEKESFLFNSIRQMPGTGSSSRFK